MAHKPEHPLKSLGSGSILLRRLNELQQNISGVAGQAGRLAQGALPDFITSFPENVRQAEAEGKNLGDVLAAPFSNFMSNVKEAEAEGLNLFDVLQQGASQVASDVSQSPLSQGVPIPNFVDPITVLADTLSGALPEPQQSFGSAAQQFMGDVRDFDRWTGRTLRRGLGLEEAETALPAEPQFDLQAAIQGLGQQQPSPAIGAGMANATAQGDQSGLNVLSSIIGPAAVLPAPVQEPIPPELDLAPIRAQFMRSQPQIQPSAVGDFVPTPEEDLEALQFANVLQGLGEGGLTGAGAPIGEMLLRVGFGGLAGLGQGMAAREGVEAQDRQQRIGLLAEDREQRRAEEGRRQEFERGLAGLDLDIAEAELANEAAQMAAQSRNLDRQYQHALAKAKQGAPQFLGMSSSGPVIMTNEEGKMRVHTITTPPTELERMEAFASLTTAQARLREAEGKDVSEGFVDPSLAGLNQHLVQVGDELVRTGAYTQIFDPDRFAEIMEGVNAKMSEGRQPISDAELADKRFNQALIAEIANMISANPDILPQLAQFSTTAAQLALAEQLAKEPSGGAAR